VWVSGGKAGDISRGLNEVAEADIDLSKQMRKDAEPDQAEEIIEGATKESIADFAQTRRDVPVPPAGVTGWFRRLFNR